MNPKNLLTRPMTALAVLATGVAGLTLIGCTNGESNTAPTGGGGLTQQGNIEPAGPGARNRPAGTNGMDGMDGAPAIQNPSGSNQVDGTTSPPISNTGGSGY